MEAALNLELQIRRPGSTPLVRGVLDADPAALRFYPRPWHEYASYAARADELSDAVTDTAWTDAVTAYGEAAEARLARIRAEGGYVVTTGQQPGLFAGPLYSLYKALTAVRLAAELEERLGRPVAPVFWVASEDHDWDETNHTWLVDVHNDLHRLELPEVEGAGSEPLYRIPLQGVAMETLGRLETLLPETPVAEEAIALFREAYHDADATLASGFQAAMERMLEPYGVLFTQAHNPVLKRLSLPVLEGAVTRAQALESALEARSAELEEAGYGVQVSILPGGVNLFLEGPAGRERLYRDEDGYHLRHSELKLTLDEVKARLHDDPGTVSPNVLVRPVVEAHVFPTLAYVAGPGELSYFAQLSPVFETLGVGMPVIHPRFGATVVERKIQKVLDKFDVAQERLFQPFHELAQEIAREGEPEEVRRALGQIRGALGKGTGELVKAAREVDPTLKGPIQHARSVAMEAFAEAEKKILQAVKRESETTLQQLEKARLHIAPDGKPQERVFGPIYYLSRYGVEWIAAVAEAMNPALPGDSGAA